MFLRNIKNPPKQIYKAAQIQKYSFVSPALSSHEQAMVPFTPQGPFISKSETDKKRCTELSNVSAGIRNQNAAHGIIGEIIKKSSNI